MYEVRQIWSHFDQYLLVRHVANMYDFPTRWHSEGFEGFVFDLIRIFKFIYDICEWHTLSVPKQDVWRPPWRPLSDI